MTPRRPSQPGAVGEEKAARPDDVAHLVVELPVGPVAGVDDAQACRGCDDTLAAVLVDGARVVPAGHGDASAPEPYRAAHRAVGGLRLRGRIEPAEEPRQERGLALGLVVGDLERGEIDLGHVRLRPGDVDVPRLPVERHPGQPQLGDGELLALRISAP